MLIVMWCNSVFSGLWEGVHTLAYKAEFAMKFTNINILPLNFNAKTTDANYFPIKRKIKEGESGLTWDMVYMVQFKIK